MLWIPLASTAFIIVVYPLFSGFAYWISLAWRKWLLSIKWKFESQEPLSRKDAAEIRLRIRDFEKIYADDLSRKDAQIRELEDQVRTLSEKPLKPNVNSELMDLVQYLKSGDSVNDYLRLASTIMSKTVYVDQNTSSKTGDYVARGLIEKNFKSGANGVHYEILNITDKGKMVYNHLKR